MLRVDGDSLGCGGGPAIAPFAFTALAVRSLGWVLLGGSAVPFGWRWDLWLSVSNRFPSSSAAGFLLVVSNPENMLTSGVPLTCAHELRIRESAVKTEGPQETCFCLSVKSLICEYFLA